MRGQRLAKERSIIPERWYASQRGSEASRVKTRSVGPLKVALKLDASPLRFCRQLSPLPGGFCNRVYHLRPDQLSDELKSQTSLGRGTDVAGSRIQHSVRIRLHLPLHIDRSPDVTVDSNFVPAETKRRPLPGLSRSPSCPSPLRERVGVRVAATPGTQARVKRRSIPGATVIPNRHRPPPLRNHNLPPRLRHLIDQAPGISPGTPLPSSSACQWRFDYPLTRRVPFRA